MDAIRKITMFAAATKFWGWHMRKQCKYFRLWLFSDNATKWQKRNYLQLHDSHKLAAHYWLAKGREITAM